MQTNKKMIWVKLEDILYDLEGDIDDAIVFPINMKEDLVGY